MLGRGKESPKPVTLPLPSLEGGREGRGFTVKALRSREQWLEGEGNKHHGRPRVSEEAAPETQAVLVL